jgi:hypothetical protein
VTAIDFSFQEWQSKQELVQQCKQAIETTMNLQKDHPPALTEQQTHLLTGLKDVRVIVHQLLALYVEIDVQLHKVPFSQVCSFFSSIDVDKMACCFFHTQTTQLLTVQIAEDIETILALSLDCKKKWEKQTEEYEERKRQLAQERLLLDQVIHSLSTRTSFFVCFLVLFILVFLVFTT